MFLVFIFLWGLGLNKTKFFNKYISFILYYPNFLSENLPFVEADTSLTDALFIMTETRTGLALVMKDGELQGVISDGDLRRFLISGKSINDSVASELMNPNPCFVSPDARLSEAEEIMREKHIKWLIVSEDAKKIDGIIEWGQ